MRGIERAIVPTTVTVGIGAGFFGGLSRLRGSGRFGGARRRRGTGFFFGTTRRRGTPLEVTMN